MVDILKITSAIPATNRIDNPSKQHPGDAVFGINNLEDIPKRKIAEKQERRDDPREALLRNLSREIFAPLKADLSAQSEGLKKFVLLLRFFDDPEILSKLGDLEELFLKPEDLLKELISRDKLSTVFQGELFEALRELAKAEGFPKLQEAIVNILRAFDCLVNRENTLYAIFDQGLRFASFLKVDDASRLLELLGRMAAMMESGQDTAAYQKEMSYLLKSELLPLMSELSGKYQFLLGDKLQNQLMAIIHQVVRFDKADARLLENGMQKLGDELRSFGKLGTEDVEDMRRMLMDHLRDAKAPVVLRPQGSLGAALAAAAGEKGIPGYAQYARAGEGQGTSAANTRTSETSTNASSNTNTSTNTSANTSTGSNTSTSSGTALPLTEAAKQAGSDISGSGASPVSEDSAMAAQGKQTAGTPAASEGSAMAAQGKQTAAAPGSVMDLLAKLAGESEDKEPAGAVTDKPVKDVSEVLAKAMEMDASTKVNAAAQSMLTQLIENESPVLALLHFLFPVKFNGEDIYSEFYVDKDCPERQGEGGEGKDAQNIFFVIQSERYGNFAVDILARDRMIDLDITCPIGLTEGIQGIQNDISEMMESLGYRMAAFKVSNAGEERSIMQRFPKLAMRKVGIDIKV